MAGAWVRKAMMAIGWRLMPEGNDGWPALVVFLKRLTLRSLRLAISAMMAWSACQTCAGAALMPEGAAAFVENVGPWADPSIRFALSGTGGSVGLTATGMSFQLSAPRQSFKVSFTGAKPATPFGLVRLQDLHALQPERVSAWSAVCYQGLYKGIDLVVMARPNGIKFEFRLAPGADWRQIQLHYDGIAGLSLDQDGALEIRPAERAPALIDRAPVIYQVAQGRRSLVAGRFRLLDAQTQGFEITGPYDPSAPLVIDPEIAWNTYLGDLGVDEAYAVALDPAGNILVAGTTSSPSWTEGGSDTTLNGVNIFEPLHGPPSDAFVVKLSPAGAHLWSACLGGIDEDCGYGIAVDGAGNAYVTGETYSQEWTSGGYKSSHTGQRDAFVAKLSPTGQHLWSSLLGGANLESGRSIAVDAAGNPCVAGYTSSPGWVSGGYDTVFNNPGNSLDDGFVLKLSSDGQHLWSTYVGGGAEDRIQGVAIDSAGDICLTGVTNSPGWVSGGFQMAMTPSDDAFVAKLTAAGQHRWSTYVSGPISSATQSLKYSYGTGIAIDSHDNVCVTGVTSLDGWARGGGDMTLNGPGDGFVIKLSPAGQALWSAYLGGDGVERAEAIAVDGRDDIYVTGRTGDPIWLAGGLINPVTSGLFVARLTAAGQYCWGANLENPYSYYNTGRGIAARGADTLVVVGSTDTANWAIGGYDTVYGGGLDGFAARLAKLDQILSGSLTVTITPPEAVAAGARWRRAGATEWLGSGQIETGVPSGQYKIEYKPVPHWTTPASVKTNLKPGGLGQLTANYGKGCGVRVMLTPPEAVAAGAKWRGTGTTAWLDSGTSETNLAYYSNPGATYTVEFKPIPNFSTPANVNISIRSGQTSETTATYALTQAELSWSTYLGGSRNDSCGGIALDAEGNLCIAGRTASAYWVAGGYDDKYEGDGTYTDAYAAKLSPDGVPIWSTYLGGAYNDAASNITVDGAGNLCITGDTSSPGWTSGGQDLTYDGSQDMFVAKLGPDGRHIWSGYLGGAQSDSAYGIAADANDNLYVTGTTNSAGWVAGGVDTTYGGNGFADGALVKLSPTGSLLWSSYLGGDAEDLALAIALDSHGDPLVVGSTRSAGWVSGGPRTTLSSADASDAYVARISSDGQRLWATLLGGSATDSAYCVALDSQDNIFVGGYTSSSGWLAGGYQTAYQGSADGFIAKLAPTGATLWGSYLGGKYYASGTGADFCRGVAVGAAGDIFVTGYTGAAGWVSGGFDDSHNKATDGFVAKLTAQGEHVWSAYLGGDVNDYAYGIARSQAGAIYILGFTVSTGWAIGGYDTTQNGGSDMFIAKALDLSPATQRGSLNVRITPPEAVAAGAQWRRVGQSPWCDSGTTVSQFPALPIPIEFKAVSGWTAPAIRTVKVEDGRTTSISVQYSHPSGSLCVTIAPPEAVAAGARWRRVGTTAWLESGATESDVPAGSCSVEFLSIADWSVSVLAGVAVNENQKTQVSNTYVSNAPNNNPTRTLTVALIPEDASAAGAKWRRIGETSWRDSWTGEGGLAPGVYRIEFKPVDQWLTPPVQSVTITSEPLSYWMVRAVYQRPAGLLCVNLHPSEAVAAGARWRRVGASAWQRSGATEAGVPIGSWAVEFSRPLGWISASQQTTVTIANLQTTTLGAGFIPSQADLVWSSYIGGSGFDYCKDVALDASGAVVAVGGSYSASDWVSGGTGNAAFQGGFYDIFITKTSPSGVHLWTTLLGGVGDEMGEAIAVDRAGNIIVTGGTQAGLWAQGGFDVTHNGGRDAFVAKLSPQGVHLWSTYLGGGGNEDGLGVAVTSGGDVVVTGRTNSDGWVTGGFKTSLGGVQDAFVVKLSADGQRLWGSYIGGPQYETGYDIALNAAGDIFVTGSTTGPGWVTGGPDATFKGLVDAFVTKLSPQGAHLWSTDLGGPDEDRAQSIGLDSTGNLYVSGSTLSSGWLLGGADTSYDGAQDGFAVKLSPTGSLLWGSYLGGIRSDSVWDSAVDAAGYLYLTGETDSPEWAGRAITNAYQGVSPTCEAFVVKLAPTGRQLWSSYLGGAHQDIGYGIAADGAGAVVIVGTSESADWTVRGFDTTYNGAVDGFIVRLLDQRRLVDVGSLIVTLAPAQAVAAGAMWRPVGSSTWRVSGAVKSDLPSGPCTIEFKAVEGWNKPANVTVTISNGAVSMLSRSYRNPRSALEWDMWNRY